MHKKYFYIFIPLVTLVLAGCYHDKQTGEVKEDVEEVVIEESPSSEATGDVAEAPQNTGVQIVEPPEFELGDLPTEPQPGVIHNGDVQEVEEPTPSTFTGTVLAGTTSPLLEYNEADYEIALAQNKNIVLYYYANWCPLCKAEFPKMQAAFDELSRDDVVGFRVSYKDDETTDDEEALAKEFGIAYQHTKVFIQNGQRVLKAPDQWEKDRYLEEITNTF